ncbi:RNA-binding protein NOB1 [Mixophyes fleayi]|uniref:RNA-binding protein NOB1 n=1 Tax=Mixophyes fleayi TaxID=3061075 RepID=UPI003F4D9766
MASTKVLHVVADAGAFIRNAVLQEIGTHIYTVREVVTEIRDKATRRRLAVLPYQLIFREPRAEHIQLVTEFAKKTGDYASLSANDIKILALTYQLEVEHVGVEHIRTEPPLKVSVSTTARHPEAPVNVAGFHLPSKPAGKTEGVPRTPATEKNNDSANQEFDSFLFWRNPLPNIEDDLLELMNAQLVSVTSSPEQVPPAAPVPDNQGNAAEESSGEEEESEDGGGWITPSNLKQIQQDVGTREAPVNVVVGCLTTDFAMQYSLPAPQGGKHASNPHLVLDQNFPQQRLSRKARAKTDVFDPDYIAGASPFAENDIYSRAANLNIRDGAIGAGRRRVNPNAPRKKCVKKR